MRCEMRYTDVNMCSSPLFACCMHSVNEIDIVIHKTTHIHTHDTFACIWTHTWTRAYIRRSYRAYGRILTVRCSTALVGLTLSLAVMRVGGSLPRSCPSPRCLSFLSLRGCACGSSGIVHLFLFPVCAIVELMISVRELFAVVCIYPRNQHQLSDICSAHVLYSHAPISSHAHLTCCDLVRVCSVSLAIPCARALLHIIHVGALLKERA